MIVLDTNVISEIMSSKPNTSVCLWLNKQNIRTLYTTWINIAEIQRGISRLPNGKRKTNLTSKFESFIHDAFGKRVLPFEQKAAQTYASLCKKREEIGLHIDPIDLIILAVAQTNGCKLATRNEQDFSECGVVIINPWEHGQ